MRILIEVNVEQFTVDELLEFAKNVGCPVSKREDRIKWLIKQYGRSLCNKMSDFISEKASEK